MELAGEVTYCCSHGVVQVAKALLELSHNLAISAGGPSKIMNSVVNTADGGCIGRNVTKTLASNLGHSCSNKDRIE